MPDRPSGASRIAQPPTGGRTSVGQRSHDPQTLDHRLSVRRRTGENVKQNLSPTPIQPRSRQAASAEFIQFSTIRAAAYFMARPMVMSPAAAEMSAELKNAPGEKRGSGRREASLIMIAWPAAFPK